jgi:hypothetical protein
MRTVVLGRDSYRLPIIDSCAVGSYVELPDLDAGFARRRPDLSSDYST